MPITSCHPDYAATLEQWQRLRDVAAGQDAVHAAGAKYLPRPAGMGPFSTEYGAYVARTPFFNATGRTIDGLAGVIHQRPPLVTVPPFAKEWLPDITLTSVPFELFALEVTREILTVGRYGVLVDYTTPGTPLLPHQRPYCAGYAAENIVSWRSTRRGGDEILTSVVLRESIEALDEKDQHVIVPATQYRELTLTEAGVYEMRVWVKLPAEHLRNPARETWIASDPVTPLRRGVPLPFIPFCFFGPSGISPAVAKPPLLDLANTNLAHYRLAADERHGLHYVALPTPWVSGAAADAVLKIGPAVAWRLEKDGSAGMLEFTGAGLKAIQEAMAEDRRLMATLGARLLEDQSTVQETATGVALRHSGERAVVMTMAQALEQGLTTVLQWVAWWADGTTARPTETPARVELNKDFWSMKMSPDELRTLTAAFQADVISFDTLYANLTRGDLTRPGVTASQERSTIARQGGAPDHLGDAA